MGGIPGIQSDGRHEPLDHPPDAVAGEGAALPGEHGRLIRDILTAGRLPRQEGLQVGLEFLGNKKDLRLLVPLALADHQ
jgi:hypothetical protein